MTPHNGDAIWFAGNALARDRVIDHHGEAYRAKVVDDAPDADTSPIDQGFRDAIS